METAIALALIPVVCGVIALIIRRMKTTSMVLVGEDIVLGGSAAMVEPALVRALASIDSAEYMGMSLGRYAVTTRRIPWWAVFPAFVLVPVSLVLLFVLRETVRLDCALFDGPHGAVLRLSGRSERRVLDAVRAAVGQLVNTPVAT